MRREGDTFIHDLAPGHRDLEYMFSVDGGEPRPDPRSNHQPHGIHGPSRVVDHSAFDWSDAGWTPKPFPNWIFYEMHVGTFTPEGTFDAAIEKLDHLVALGVTAIEMMPVAEFPGDRGWGYDGVDLYAPHHVYGGPDGLKRLVDACHSRGLAVVLDVVYNHLGPDGNYHVEFGPYFTERYATPWGAAINYDGPDSDQVRRFFVDNAIHWLSEYHFDALRIDAIHAILDLSAIHFLEQIAREVAALADRTGRRLYVTAESDLNDPRVVRGWDVGGYGLDAQWNDDFHHALHTLLTGERAGYYADFGDVAHLARALENTFVYAGDDSAHRRRIHGRPAHDVPKHRFVGYLQNHDQIGNRARGERSSHLLTTDQLKLGAAVVLLSPFVPMLFQGEEWAASTPFRYFTDHDPELGRAVSAGRKREFAAFGWDPEDVPDPQDPETFRVSKLDWSEPDNDPHKEMLEWHKQLIDIRKQHLEAEEDLQVSFDERPRQLTFSRGPVTVESDLDTASVRVMVDRDVVLANEGSPSIT
jgi:maltooligosyltrehalose trehalohydrolase